jgi:hypothetical protein
MPTLINSLEDLKDKATNSDLPCYIMLSGFLRSSKDVLYNPDNNLWSIYNHVDDTEQELSTEELSTRTMIIEAIEKKAFYRYDS